jgi:hypothetical protein
MRKVELPAGLIRYSSEARLQGLPFRLPGRVYVYTAALTVFLSLIAVLTVTRSEVQATILRQPGTLYYETDQGLIRNLYQAKLINKTARQLPIELRLAAPSEGTLTRIMTDSLLAPGGVLQATFFVDIPRAQMLSNNISVTIELVSRNEVLQEVTTTFVGPSQAGNR